MAGRTLFFLLALLISPHFCAAQSPNGEHYRSPAIPTLIEPLPPVRVAELTPLYSGTMNSPPEVYEPLAVPPDVDFYAEFDQAAKPTQLPGTREGVFQRVVFSDTWLPAGGGAEFGMQSFATSVTFGFPLPTRESPLVIRPNFDLNLLDGPAERDVPPQVYDAGLEFRWIHPFGDKWLADLAVEPRYAADFETNRSDAVRVTGRAVAVWNRTAMTKIILGAAYVDRGSIRVVPVGGVMYTPHEDVSYELVFPRPRIAWRPHGWFGQDDWLYVAGEFGGGTWAIEHTDGSGDLLGYSDYRVLLGFERKTPLGLQPLAEIGYVFGRKLEFDSSTPDFRPDDTLVLRLGLAY